MALAISPAMQAGGGRVGGGDPVFRSAVTKFAGSDPAGTPAAQPAPGGGMPLPAPGASAQPAVVPTPPPAPQVVGSSAVHDANGVPVGGAAGGMPQITMHTFGAPPVAAGSGNLSPIDPNNSLRGQQINYNVPAAQVDFGGLNVSAGSVAQAAKDAFMSQLPALNFDMADQAKGLVKHTAAMGRTGSGLFNRGTNEISDRGRATREALLGNIGFQGATTDASNSLQAALANQQMQQSGRLFNANSTEQAGRDALALQERQQGRQDNLGQQSFNNILAQLGLLGDAGFGGDPTNADLTAANQYGNLAETYGANATQTGGQVADAASAAVPSATDWISQLLNPVPKAPAALPMPTNPFPGAIDPNQFSQQLYQNEG